MPHNNNNRDVSLKMIIITMLSVLFIVLIYNVLSGGGSGIISRLYYGQGLNLNSFVTSVLVAAVKLLWLVFVVSLIFGLVLLVRKNLVGERRANPNFRSDHGDDGYSCPCCHTRLTADFKFCPNCKASLKDICMKCGRELQVGWRCCPVCGTEKRVK